MRYKMTDNRSKRFEKEILKNGSPKYLQVDLANLKEKYDAKNLTVSLTKLPFEFDENGKPKALNSNALKNYVTLYSNTNQFQCSVCKRKYNNRKCFSHHIYTHMGAPKKKSSGLLVPLLGLTRRSITRCMAFIFIISALFYYSTDVVTRCIERPSWFRNPI